jgi:hypothetical protein
MIRVIFPVQAGTNECKSYLEEIPAQIKRKEGTWIQVITGHHKISRKPEIMYAQPILMSVNRYELSNNLKESMSHKIGDTKVTKDREQKKRVKERTKLSSLGSAMREGVRQK